MNSIWNFLSSMSLSAQNKQWLGEKLLADARQEMKSSDASPVITKEDLCIDSYVANMFKDVCLPEDFDERKAYHEYLAEKYK
ncbi:MAG: hypothetical protein K2M96_05620 [Prevotella sp.]|nr:hypothetical protein [Prevotella sp.]